MRPHRHHPMPDRPLQRLPRPRIHIRLGKPALGRRHRPNRPRQPAPKSAPARTPTHDPRLVEMHMRLDQPPADQPPPPPRQPARKPAPARSRRSPRPQPRYPRSRPRPASHPGSPSRTSPSRTSPQPAARTRRRSTKIAANAPPITRNETPVVAVPSAYSTGVVTFVVIP